MVDTPLGVRTIKWLNVKGKGGLQPAMPDNSSRISHDDCQTPDVPAEEVSEDYV